MGLLFSLGAIVLLFSQVNLGQAWEVLAHMDSRLMLAPLVFSFAGIPLRPWRWQVIFPPPARPGFWPCFWALALGNMANNVLPARGGDVLRCVLITRGHSGAGISFSLAALGLEKILDGLALVGVVSLTFFMFVPPRWLGQLVLIAGLVFGGALVALALMRIRSLWSLEIIRSTFRMVRLGWLGEKVVGLVRDFSDGLGALGSRWQMGALVLLTWLIWATEAMVVWGLASTLSIGLSVPGALAVTAVLGLGLGIPAAPGFVGTYEFFSVTGLTLSGIPLDAAMALTMVSHAWSLLTTTGLGLLSLAFENISLADVLRGRIRAMAVPLANGR